MVLLPQHRSSMRHQSVGYRSRSLSPKPRAPYLWHERETDSSDRQSRKGFYRVDYGPNKSEETWYLPTFKDKMNFIEKSVVRATSEPRTRAISVPPSTLAVRRTGALSIDPIVRYPNRWRTWPNYYSNYRWPYSTSYDRYWPYSGQTEGPYSGRLWKTPSYRYYSSPLSLSTSWRSYAPRYTPRYYPSSYLDYDYGYGSYSYPNYYPRHSRYDYLDDLDSPYLSTTYRPRAIDLDTDYRDKAALPTTTRTRTTRGEDVSKAVVPGLEQPATRVRAYPRPEDLPGESVGESCVSRLERRYPRLSESQMLHDHVENMRHRLKSLAYSLDPTGPVPEIIIPERTTTTTTTTKRTPALPALEDKKYSSSAVEYSELPKLASRRQRYYPEDEHIKDNLRIQCLSHYKTTRTAAEYPKSRLYESTGNEYWKPKQYIPTEPLSVMPDTSSYRASKYSATKWEEPDTVYGGPSDKKPYSKAITDGATDEAAEEKKERRKKKKSKERDLEASTSSVTGAAAAELSTSEADPVSVPAESDAGALDADEEEKERKKLEKKKRKAERETAAKAAMEAELAALAAAEAELARLEAESSKPEAGAPKAAPAEADPAEVKSESAAEKCESSAEVVCEGVSVKPESLGELAPSYTPPQIPPQEEPEATQVFEEPHATPETEQAVEPQAEEPQPEIPEEEPIMEDLPPLKESVVEYPPVEEPQVEPPVEEPPVEAAPVEAAPEESPVEPLVDEAPVESSVEPSWFEAAPVESPEEPPVDEAPVESSVEPPVEEAPAEPLVEVEQIEEPQAEPALEEPQVEETSVEEPVEMAEEPSLAPQRRTALEEDSGWLDAWDGEAAAPEADAQEAGQQLGTDKSEEPATIQAEEAWPGVQEDTEAAADATATTTDAANAIPDADVAAEAGTDDTADPAEATPSTRFDEDLDE